MYHEFNSYRLLDKERLTLKKEEKQLKYEAFVLGDFIVSFGLALKSGEISGEMCLHGGGTPAYIFDFNGKDVVTRYTKEFVTTLSEKKTDISVFYSVERRRFDIYVDGKLVAISAAFYGQQKGDTTEKPSSKASSTARLK